MATSKNNIITHGLSGKVGDMLVFSQRNGKTVVSKVPDTSNVEKSEKQKQVNQRFQEAVIYAKAAMADAHTKEAYQDKAQGGKTAYNVAIADYFNAPDIEHIDLSGYTGQSKQKIVIRTTDDFKVVQVTLAIYNANGTLLEKGDAVIQPNGLDWLYTTTATNDQMTGDKIVVRAYDLPHNMTESQQTL